MGDFASTVVDSWLGSTPVDITCFLPLCVRSGIWKSEKKHFYIYFCCSYKLESSKQWFRVPTTMNVRQLKIKVKLSTKQKMEPLTIDVRWNLHTRVQNQVPLLSQLMGIEMKQYYLTEIVFSMLPRSTWIGFSVRLDDAFCCAFSPVSADFFFFLFFFFFFWFSPSSTVSTMASAERCSTPRPSLEDCSLSCEGLTRTGC